MTTAVVPSLLYAAGVLAAILVVIVGAGRLARSTRFKRLAGGIIQPARGMASLDVIEALSLDPRRKLLLIRCDGRRVLLLIGPHDLVVGWMPDASP